MLKNCIQKLGKQISSTDRDDLLAGFEAHKGRGLSDYDASTEALADYHKNLFDQVNDLRVQVKAKPAEYKPFSFENASVEAAAAPAPLTPSKRAEMRRTSSPEELTERGIAPLAETGGHGQVSHYMRTQGFASNPEIIKALTGEEIGTGEKPTTHHINAVLDTIASESGKSRSSELSPVLWRKWLALNADRIGIDATEKAEHALLLGSKNAEQKKELLTRSVAFLNKIPMAEGSSLEEVPKSVKTTLLKKAQEIYGKSEQNPAGLSAAAVKRVVGEAVSEFNSRENAPSRSEGTGREALEGSDRSPQAARAEGNIAPSIQTDNRQRPAARPSSEPNTESGQHQILTPLEDKLLERRYKNSPELKEQAKREIEFARASEVDAPRAGEQLRRVSRINLDDVSTPVEKALIKAIEDVHAANYSDNHLIKFGRTQIKDGTLFVNPRAAEFYNRALIANGQAKGNTPFQGGHLAPAGHFEAVKYLDKYVSNLPAALKPKAEKLLNDFIDAADLTYGDIVIVPHSPAAPEGIKLARQEEGLHRADFRTRKNREINTQRFLANPAVDSVKSPVEEDGYDPADASNFSAEIIAKSLTDFANTTLGASDETLAGIKDAYWDELAELGVTPEDVALHFSGISQRAEEFVENVRQKPTIHQGNTGQADAGAGDAIGSGGQGQTKVSRVKQNRFAGDDTDSARNADELTRLRRARILAAARRENELGIQTRGLQSSLTSLHRASAAPTDEQINDAPDELEKNVQFIEKYIYDGKRDVSLAEAAVNTARSGVLMAYSVVRTNLLGNTLNAASELASQPFAALADLIVANHTNKTRGRRTLMKPSAKGIASGIAGRRGALRKGVKDLSRVVTRGMTDAELVKFDQNDLPAGVNPAFIRNTGIVPLDVLIEAAKRISGAIDKPFRAFGEERARYDTARVEAANLAKFSKAEIDFKATMRALVENPSELMQERIEAYGSYSTFQDSNRASKLVERGRRWLISENVPKNLRPVTHLAYVGAGVIMPFINTPMSVWSKGFDYFPPTGAMKAAYAYHQIGKGEPRAKWTEASKKNREQTIRALHKSYEQENKIFDAETNKIVKGYFRKFNQRQEAFQRSVDAAAAQPLFDKIKQTQIASIEKEKSEWLSGWNDSFDAYKAKREALTLEIENKRDKSLGNLEKIWTDEDKNADLFFSEKEAEMFARIGGHFGLGSTLSAMTILGLVYGLVKIIGSDDDDDWRADKSRKDARRQANILPESIGIGGVRFQVLNMHPAGRTILTITNMMEQYERDGGTDARAYAMGKSIVSDLMDGNPYTDALWSDKFKGKTPAETLANKLAMPIPRVIEELGDMLDESPRKTFGEGAVAQFMKKFPYLREKLPAAALTDAEKKERGDLKRRLIKKIIPVNFSIEERDQSELPVTSLPKPKEDKQEKKERKAAEKAKEKEVPLTPEQKQIGIAALNRVINSPTMPEAAKEKARKRLATMEK